MNSNTLNFITLKVDTHIFRVTGIIKAVGSQSALPEEIWTTGVGRY